MRVWLLAALLLCGCKKKSEGDPDLARAIELRNDVCRCKDLTCAEKAIVVFEKDGGLPKEVTAALGQAHAVAMECFAKLQVQEPPVAPDASVENLPAAPATLEAGALLAAARAWQQTNLPEMGISEVAIDYVEANGSLDAEHGGFGVTFGPLHQPADDPKRKTGAPIPKERPRPSICPTLTFHGGKWQRHDAHHCNEAPTSAVKCSAAEIWKRALATKYLKTPADALAVLKYRAVPRPVWRFSISDDLRNVSIDHYFDDTCEMAVEKPQ